MRSVGAISRGVAAACAAPGAQYLDVHCALIIREGFGRKRKERSRLPNWGSVTFSVEYCHFWLPVFTIRERRIIPAGFPGLLWWRVALRLAARSVLTVGSPCLARNTPCRFACVDSGGQPHVEASEPTREDPQLH